MVDTISNKGDELEMIEDHVTDFVSTTAGVKLEETEELRNKLKLVQEEYTIILKAVCAQLNGCVDYCGNFTFYCTNFYLIHC